MKKKKSDIVYNVYKRYFDRKIFMPFLFAVAQDLNVLFVVWLKHLERFTTKLFLLELPQQQQKIPFKLPSVCARYGD